VQEVGSDQITHGSISKVTYQRGINAVVWSPILQDETRLCNVERLQDHINSATEKQFTRKWCLFDLFPLRAEKLLRSKREVCVQLMKKQNVQGSHSVALVKGLRRSLLIEASHDFPICRMTRRSKRSPQTALSLSVECLLPVPHVKLLKLVLSSPFRCVDVAHDACLPALSQLCQVQYSLSILWQGHLKCSTESEERGNDEGEHDVGQGCRVGLSLRHFVHHFLEKGVELLLLLHSVIAFCCFIR
jgi:hypothetical protein